MQKALFLIALSVSFPSLSKEDDNPNWFEVVVSAVKDAADVIIENEIPIPVYGNYCGPRHGDHKYAVAPIDAVDHACMRHDRCYDRKYLSCECDYLLIKDLQSAIVKADKWNHGHLVAAGIMAWFANSDCDCASRNGSFHRLSSPSLDDKAMCRSTKLTSA